MSYYKNKNNGAVIFRDEPSRLISVWVEISSEEASASFVEEAVKLREKKEKEKKSEPVLSTVPTVSAISEVIEVIEVEQVFDNVADLRRLADKARHARTKRGVEYEYVNGEWVKVA